MNPSYCLPQLFPGGDFAWAFRMRKADPAEFFAMQDENGELLREKREILAQQQQRHLVFDQEATPLMGKLKASLKEWGLDLSAETELQAIARQIEPDLILMDQPSQRLIAGAVCFPSSWNPANWLNSTIHDIHKVVPKLNPQIGVMIARFLTELKPGKAFQRANWSFTRSAELNYHPALNRPTLDPSVCLEEVHLRIEHQLFTAIEGAILMGIRIQPIPLLSLAEDRTLWGNLIQVLETIPEDVARYKNLHLGRQRLSELMRQH
jgi:hypothetical protein